MIKRRKLVTQQDSIRQGSLTAQKGIDLSKAPIQPDTMADIVNFDVDDDGGLVLRKPLLLAHTDATASFVFYAFDGSRVVVDNTDPYSAYSYINIDGSGISSWYDAQYYANLLNLPNFILAYGRGDGSNDVSVHVTLLPKWFNTSTSTIILCKSGNSYYWVRLIKLTVGKNDSGKDTLIWALEKHIPEPNYVYSGDTISYNPNLLTADPDVVTCGGSGVFQPTGLLPYMLCTPTDTYARVLIGNTADYVVNGTYQTHFQTPAVVLWGYTGTPEWSAPTVDKNYYGTVKYLPVDEMYHSKLMFCLKMLYTGELPEDAYIVWEYTYDGVTYNTIEPELLSTYRTQTPSKPWGCWVPTNSATDGGPAALKEKYIVTIARPKRLLSDYDGSEMTSSEIISSGTEVQYEKVSAVKLTDWATVLYAYPAKDSESGPFGASRNFTVRVTVYEKHPTKQYEDVQCVRMTLGMRDWLYTVPNNNYSLLTDGRSSYIGVHDGYTHVAPIDIANSKVLYSNTRMYNFGKSLKSVIYPSDAGSFITPLYNQINLSANEDSTVNALIPWRNNLIAMTDTAVYRIVESDSGFTSATVTTFTGIPDRDSRTAKAILNGIIFKSHEKVFTLYPNTYSEDENILRLSEISTPVAKYVTDSETDTSFAIVTPSEYLLFTRFGNEERTQCLRYSYSTRVWSRYIFEVALIDYSVRSVTDIRLFGTDYKHEYYFDKLVEEVVDVSTLTSPELYDNITYGDWLTTVVNPDNVQAVLDGTVEPPATPFEFAVDSGQKSDAMGIVKQFIETKATYTAQSDNADFPTELSLYIDGDEHPLQLEEATDAAVQRGNQNSLVLGTEVHTASASLKDTTVRYFAKHSGKGKSIRYVLKGKSVSRFKLYEIAYRYRLPRSKQ